MDVASRLDALVPAAKYGGSLTANTQGAYDALRWADTRTKPTWADIEAQTDPVDAVKVRRQELRDKAVSGTLTAQEIQELLGMIG